MKRLLIFTFLIAIGSTSFAKSVDEATAMKVGRNFLASRLSSAPGALTLSYKSFAPVSPLTTVGQPVVYLYVFSAGNNGYVIVSGDDRVMPILGFSDEGGFVSKNMSGEIAFMLNKYTSDINYDVKNNISATEEVRTQWENLINETYSQPKSGTVVSPLLKTTWDQEPYYNALCPYDYSYGQKTVTGCVATAMAQVMRFWKYPAVGIGTNSYPTYQYGTLTVDFATTKYFWDSMPLSVNSSNSYVATLMYDCGVAVNMSYGVGSTGGSGAWVVPQDNKICAEYALQTYFGYSAAMSGLERSNYTDAAWILLLDNELTAGRPVIYSGYEPSGGGHCFDFDGYIISQGTNYFHVNWGWSGLDNGYYTINSLKPANVGVGGGSGDFDLKEAAIFGIQPDKSSAAGIQNIPTKGNLTIYPNPARNYAIANLTGFDGIPQQLSIINTEGKLVYSQATGTDKSNIEINTSNIPDGVYFVRILTDKGILNSKLVVAQ